MNGAEDLSMPSAPNSTIVRLRGGIQTYGWGSTVLLPALLGVEPNGEPQAELWLGAHPACPSRLLGDGDPEQSLLDAIETDPQLFLGTTEPLLPFLLKVLAVGGPLSIQVHPSIRQAVAGFDRENEAGIALDAPNRCYRDSNHKPEIICARTNFELLCGFVGDDVLRSRLHAIVSVAPELGSTLGVSSANFHIDRGLLMTSILRMSAAESTVAVAAVMTALAAELAHLLVIGEQYPADPGVVVAALMNHRILQPGEAMYFPAGIVHAYLSGLGVELLANSDNVLRCGLTPKHIDVTELLAVASLQPSDPDLFRPNATGVGYDLFAPCQDFALTMLRASRVLGASSSPRIVLVLAGAIRVKDLVTGSSIALRQGESAWVFPDVDLELDGGGEAFDAAIASSPYLG